MCVASHDGVESSAVCVHQFLFPSGENWCWNIRNAASSFRRVLPKSIEDVWVVFPFQKWTPILWRRPPPKQAVHLPHWGDRGTCAKNCSRWPTSIREVAEDVEIAFSMCQKILTADLQMRRVSAKFVPHLLTAEQKDDHVSICTDLRERAQNDPNFMSSVITGDESWVYGYDPETKQMSSQWKTATSPRPKKARQVKSNVKTMLIAFFDTDGLIHHEYVPRGQMVNKEFYKTVLQSLRNVVCRHRPEKWRSDNWILHHDNAPAHRAVTTNEFLAKHNIHPSHTSLLPWPCSVQFLVPVTEEKNGSLPIWWWRDSSQRDETNDSYYKKWIPEVLLSVAGTLE